MDMNIIAKADKALEDLLTHVEEFGYRCAELDASEDIDDATRRMLDAWGEGLEDRLDKALYTGAARFTDEQTQATNN